MSTVTRIQCLIEVPGSSYGADWTMGDIAKQAKRGGLEAIQKMVKAHGGRTIGEPTIVTIIDTEERR